MTALIDTETSPAAASAWRRAARGLLAVIAGLGALAGRRRIGRVEGLSDRALADLNIRRFEVDYPDPRAPRLF